MEAMIFHEEDGTVSFVVLPEQRPAKFPYIAELQPHFVAVCWMVTLEDKAEVQLRFKPVQLLALQKATELIHQGIASGLDSTQFQIGEFSETGYPVLYKNKVLFITPNTQVSWELIDLLAL